MLQVNCHWRHRSVFLARDKLWSDTFESTCTIPLWRGEGNEQSCLSHHIPQTHKKSKEVLMITRHSITSGFYDLRPIRTSLICSHPSITVQHFSLPRGGQYNVWISQSLVWTANNVFDHHPQHYNDFANSQAANASPQCSVLAPRHWRPGVWRRDPSGDPALTPTFPTGCRSSAESSPQNWNKDARGWKLIIEMSSSWNVSISKTTVINTFRSRPPNQSDYRRLKYISCTGRGKTRFLINRHESWLDSGTLDVP